MFNVFVTTICLINLFLLLIIFFKKEKNTRNETKSENITEKKTQEEKPEPDLSLEQYLKYFETYTVMYNYYCDKAFEIIYKRDIFPLFSNGFKYNDDDLKKAIVEFSHLATKMMGIKLSSELISVYGEESFFFNLSNYFYGRYEDDSIQRIYTESISSSMEK